MASEERNVSHVDQGRRVHPKKYLGRFTIRTCVIFWLSVLFLFLLIAFILVIFLHILPKGIEKSYKHGFKFEDMKLSEWTFFPDQENLSSITLDGIAIHPKPYWGYTGELHAWTFLNEKNNPIFNAQPIHESNLPNSPLKKAFKSKMMLQLSNTSRKNFQKLNQILTEFFHSTKTSRRSNSLGKVRMSGKFGLGGIYIYRNIDYEVPFQELQRAILKKEAFRFKKNGLPNEGFKLNQVNVKVLEEGIRLEIYHTTKDFAHGFRLPKGNYPIYSGEIPVIILRAKDEFHIQENSRNKFLSLDFVFVQPFEESGSLLFSVLPLVVNTGKLELKLKGPALDNQESWTKDKIGSSSWPGLELPNFRDHLNQIQQAFKEMTFRPKRIFVQGNQIHVDLEFEIPEILVLDTLSIDFGAKLKFRLNHQDVLELVLSHVFIDTDVVTQRQYIQLKLGLTIPQEAIVTETVLELFTSLSEPSTNIHLEVKDIRLFPIQTSILRCAWCDSIFAQVHHLIPMTTQSIQETLHEAFHFFETKIISQLGKVKFSHLSISNKKQFGSFEFQVFLDMSTLGIDFEEIDLPLTWMTWKYRGTTLGKLSLPQGFYCQSCSNVLTQLELEFQVNHDVQVQPYFNELFQHFFHHSFTNATLLQLNDLTLGPDDASILTFQPYSLSIFPPSLYQWVQNHVEMDSFKTSLLYFIQLLSFHLKLLNGQHFLASTDFQVHSSVPFSLDLNPFSFVIHVPNLSKIQLSVPNLKIKEGDSHVRIENLGIQSKLPFNPKLISLVPSKWTSILPNQFLVSSLRFEYGENNENPSKVTLDSFSKLQYGIKLKTLTSLGKQLDLSKFINTLNEAIVHSMVLHDIKHEAPNRFVIDLDVEYSLENHFSIDVGFLSLDFFIHGAKRCHVQLYISKSQKEERKKLSLHLHLELYEGPLEEANECKIESETEAAFCIKNLSFGEDESKQKAFLPVSILFTESTIIHFLPSLQRYFESTEVHFYNVLGLRPELIWKLLIHFFVKPPNSGLLYAKPNSTTLNINENKFSLDVELEIPMLLFDLKEFQLVIFVSCGSQHVLKGLIQVSNYQVFLQSSKLKLHTELQFLDLSEWSIHETTQKDLTLLMKRDSTNFENKHPELLQSLLDASISLTLVEGNGKGILGILLDKTKGVHFKLPISLTNLTSVFFNHLEKETDMDQLTKALQTISMHQIDVFKTTSIFDQRKLPVLGLGLQFQFLDTFSLPFPVSVNLYGAAVDISVNETKVGILGINGTFKWENVLNSFLLSNLTYYAVNAVESQMALGQFIDSLFDEKLSSASLYVKNFRFHSEKSSLFTLLSLLSYSTASHTVRASLANFAHSSIKDDHKRKRNAQENSNQTEVATPLSTSIPKVQMHSMSFFIETDSGFHLGMCAQSFIWNKGPVRLEGVQVSIEDKKKTQSFFGRLQQPFTLFHLRIGEGAQFPSTNEPDLIDGFAFLRLRSDVLAHFLPIQNGLNLVQTWKALSLDKIDVNQDSLNDYYLLQLRTILKYGQTTETHLPSFNLEVPLGQQLMVQVENSPSSNSSKIDVMEVRTQFKVSQPHSFCKNNFLSNQTVFKRICLSTLAFSDATLVHPHHLHVQANGFLLFMDLDIQSELAEYLFDYAVALIRQNAIHASQPNTTDETQSITLPSKYEQLKDKVMFGVKLRVPPFLNLRLNLKYLRFKLFHATEYMKEKRNVYTIELTKMVASTTKTFNQIIQVFVKHSLDATKQPLNETESIAEDTWLFLDIKVRNFTYRIPIPRTFAYHARHEEHTLKVLYCFQTQLTGLTNFVADLLASTYALKNATLRLVEEDPRVELRVRMLRQPSSLNPGFDPKDYFLHVYMQNFQVSINQTKIEPRKFIFDGVHGMLGSILVDIPKNPYTGELAQAMFDLFPEDILERFEKIKEDTELTTMKSNENETKKEKIEDSEKQIEEEDEHAEGDPDEEEGETLEKKKEKEQSLKNLVECEDCESSDEERKEDEEELIETIPVILNNLYFGNEHPIPMNALFQLPKDILYEFDEVLPDFDYVTWKRLHLNFTENFAMFYFSGEIESDLSFSIKDHVLTTFVSLAEDLLVKVACKELQLVNHVFSGVVYISIPSNATFRKLADFPNNLKKIHLHHLQLSSIHPTRVPPRMLFIRKFYPPIPNSFMKLPPLKSFISSITRIEIPNEYGFSVELPYLKFRIRLNDIVGQAEIQNIRIPRNKQKICIVTNAANYFILGPRKIGASEINFFELSSSYFVTDDIRFGLNKEASLFLKGFKHIFYLSTFGLFDFTEIGFAELSLNKCVPDFELNMKSINN